MAGDEEGLLLRLAQAAGRKMEAIASIVEAQPVLTAVVVIAGLWYIAAQSIKGKALRLSRSADRPSNDEGRQRAREKQQQLLEQSAAARAAAVPNEVARKAAPDIVPPPTSRPGPSSSSQPGPSSSNAPSHPKSASDKESYTQRLARLEKGKESTISPLQGPENGSSAPDFCRRKKGGG